MFCLRNDPLSTSSIDRYESLSSRGIGEIRRPYSRYDREDTTDYKKVRTSHRFIALPLIKSYFLWTCNLLRLQLYEQILGENDKLKAQLRDTEFELADLKLQLEKATQVSLFLRVLRNWEICFLILNLASSALEGFQKMT